MALVDLDATLNGTSSGTAALDLDLGLFATLAGTSTVSGTIVWKARPGTLPSKPASNSAATLDQFLASVGPGKAVTRTPSSNSTVVDPNPPRKPFTPR